jgi:predicted ATPase
MNITAQEAAERYQSQVPRLKREFAESLQRLDARFQYEQNVAEHQKHLSELIANEIVRRMTIAANSLIEALDAGWRPSDDQLSQTYTDALNALDYPRKSFDDIFAAADYIPGKDYGDFAQVVGESMTTTSAEARSRLKLHLNMLTAKDGSAPRRREYTSTRINSVRSKEDRFRFTQVNLINYKSVAQCSVPLHQLTILIGPNGAGKSNFIDSVNFVSEALYDSLEYAIRERGGIAQLIRQTPGLEPYVAQAPPLSEVPFFEVSLSFSLGADSTGLYRVRVGQSGTEFRVLQEECEVGSRKSPSREYFVRERNSVRSSIELQSVPKEDRLYLGALSLLEPFSSVFDGLTSGMFYVIDLKQIRDAQPIDSGSFLAGDCWNIASVVSRLQTKAPRIKQRIEAYLRRIIADDVVLRTRTAVPYIFLEYWQGRGASQSDSLKLLASSMSDGTLRATALLIALLQPPDVDDDNLINLVAFEEPETGLQPSALRVLLDAIQESSRSRQVIFTTHSPELLDNKDLEVKSIMTVLFQEGSTRIGPVNTRTAGILRDGLATVSELLRQSGALTPE